MLRLRMLAPAVLVAMALIAPMTPAGAVGIGTTPPASAAGTKTAHVQPLSTLLGPRLSAELHLAPPTDAEQAAGAVAVALEDWATHRFVGTTAGGVHLVLDLGRAGDAFDYSLTVLDRSWRPRGHASMTAVAEATGAVTYEGHRADGSAFGGRLDASLVDAVAPPGCSILVTIASTLLCEELWSFCSAAFTAGDQVYCSTPNGTPSEDTMAYVTTPRIGCSDVDCTATANFFIITVRGLHPKGVYIAGAAQWRYFYGTQPLDYTIGTGTTLDTNPPLDASVPPFYDASNMDLIAYDPGLWQITDRCFPEVQVELLATYLDGREERYVTGNGSAAAGPTVNCPA